MREGWLDVYFGVNYLQSWRLSEVRSHPHFLDVEIRQCHYLPFNCAYIFHIKDVTNYRKPVITILASFVNFLLSQSEFGEGWGEVKIYDLFTIAIAAVHELDWSLLILLIWGLGLSLNAWNVYQSEGEEYEQACGRGRLKKSVGQ
ncbi:hypothetical protein D0A34_03795 [Microcoleus vaginatus PCC 9802]|nr:hypothetical protein D0A34_03795 [Microcoleus vaginatus PCC 9802]